MATYPVKYINNAMRGAPQISGTAGTFIAALDAFLLNGFGQVTALSVNVSGGIATASLNAGQSFDKHAIVLVAGATPAALNGEARVLTATNSAITWATTAPDGAATGVITIKVAPVGGWQKAYAGTNVAVYRSSDPQASGFCVRIDDSGTTTVRLRGFESMSDVDTGTGPFPTDAQISGGGYMFKSNQANANAVHYDMAADSRMVLWALAASTANSTVNIAAPVRGFGDLVPLKTSGDAFAVGIACAAGASLTSGANFSSGTFDRPPSSAADANNIYLPRAVTATGGAVLAGALSYVGAPTAASAVSGADGTLGAFPSSVDGQLRYCRRYVHAGDGATPRAEVPGLLYIPQSGVLSSVARRDTVAGSGELAGRLLLAVPTGSSTANAATATGIVLLDITGPWR